MTSSPALPGVLKSNVNEATGVNPRQSRGLAANTKVIVTSIQSLLQPVPSREAMAAATREVRVGGRLDEQEFTRWLTERGGHATTAVELPGEFSLRGGILDVFAPDAEDPVRIELFGDDVESIRRFDVATQRSLETLEAATITLLAPTASDRRTSRAICRREHGFCCLSRASSLRRGSFIWSGWIGRRLFMRCGRPSKRFTSFRR